MKIYKSNNEDCDIRSDVYIECDSNSLPPLVNPTLEDAKTYKFDRAVIFTDNFDIESWWNEVKKNAYYQDI